METTTKPLYKVLNEQRTQGEWTRINGRTMFPTVVMEKINVPNEDEGTLYLKPPHFVINNGRNPNANADYIILAVNNLAEVADCLQRLMDFTLKKDTGEYLDTLLNDCESAIAAIS